MVEITNFLDRLTPTEKRGYYTIIDKIRGDNGMITVNTLSEETGIAIETYRSLLSKMKKYGAAAVVGCGRNGTSITIVDPILREEAQNYKILEFLHS